MRPFSFPLPQYANAAAITIHACGTCGCSSEPHPPHRRPMLWMGTIPTGEPDPYPDPLPPPAGKVLPLPRFW